MLDEVAHISSEEGVAFPSFIDGIAAVVHKLLLDLDLSGGVDLEDASVAASKGLCFDG